MATLFMAGFGVDMVTLVGYSAGMIMREVTLLSDVSYTFRPLGPPIIRGDGTLLGTVGDCMV